jgi:presenilin-like A22 family membrane protease
MALVMFEYATSGKFEAAAVIGIILAVFSLIITLVMFKVNDAISIKR